MSFSPSDGRPRPSVFVEESPTNHGTAEGGHPPDSCAMNRSAVTAEPRRPAPWWDLAVVGLLVGVCYWLVWPVAFQPGRDWIADAVSPQKINGDYAFDGWHLCETHPGPVTVRPLRPWWDYRIWDHLNFLESTADAILNSPEAAWWSGPVRPPGEVDYVVSVSSPKFGLQGIGRLSGGVHGGAPPDNNQRFHEIRRYPFVSGWRGRIKFVYVLQRISSDRPNDSASAGEQP